LHNNRTGYQESKDDKVPDISYVSRFDIVWFRDHHYQKEADESQNEKESKFETPRKKHEARNYDEPQCEKDCSNLFFSHQAVLFSTYYSLFPQKVTDPVIGGMLYQGDVLLSVCYFTFDMT